MRTCTPVVELQHGVQCCAVLLCAQLTACCSAVQCIKEEWSSCCFFKEIVHFIDMAVAAVSLGSFAVLLGA
jgi:hypothetical protein